MEIMKKPQVGVFKRFYDQELPVLPDAQLSKFDVNPHTKMVNHRYLK